MTVKNKSEGECDIKMQRQHAGQLAKHEAEIEAIKQDIIEIFKFRDMINQIKEAIVSLKDTLNNINTNLAIINREHIDLVNKDIELSEKVNKLENDFTISEKASELNTRERIENKKTNYTLIGVVVVAILSVVGIIIPFIFGRG